MMNMSHMGGQLVVDRIRPTGFALKTRTRPIMKKTTPTIATAKPTTAMTISIIWLRLSCKRTAFPVFAPQQTPRSLADPRVGYLTHPAVEGLSPREVAA
jgi:hypothetical protein